MYTQNKTLQAATVIAKTTQTLIGAEIDLDGADYLTIFLAYTKGDETGLILKPYFLPALGGTKSQVCDWAATSGAYTGTATSITFTASATKSFTWDVRGISAFRLEAGGSNNDGTPTGTLAAKYTAKG